MGTFLHSSAKPRGRQRFKCGDCGLEFSGRVRANGGVYADDRTPDNDAPVQACVCWSCLQQTVAACLPPTEQP